MADALREARERRDRESARITRLLLAAAKCRHCIVEPTRLIDLLRRQDSKQITRSPLSVKAPSDGEVDNG